MGMAASQCRLLCLTARLSDLELKAQTISNSKIRLSMASEKAATEYTAALNKEDLTLLTGYDSSGSATYTDLTYDSLTGPDSPLLTQYALADSSGKILVTQEQATNFVTAAGDVDKFVNACIGTETKTDSLEAHYTNIFNKMTSDGYITQSDEDSTINSTEWIQSQIENGSLIMEKVTDGEWESTSYSSDSNINSETDDSDQAKAEAKYEATMADIETKDKVFDLQLKNIDTEHSATQTEVDSVKKVIDKNIERNFKMFDA
jgi:hypothetical protein